MAYNILYRNKLENQMSATESIYKIQAKRIDMSEKSVGRSARGQRPEISSSKLMKLKKNSILSTIKEQYNNTNVNSLYYSFLLSDNE